MRCHFKAENSSTTSNTKVKIEFTCKAVACAECWEGVPNFQNPNISKYLNRVNMRAKHASQAACHKAHNGRGPGGRAPGSSLVLAF